MRKLDVARCADFKVQENLPTSSNIKLMTTKPVGL